LVLKSRFAKLTVIPTENNIRYHFGTYFQRVNRKNLRSFAQRYVCLQSFSGMKLFKERTAHLLISTSVDIWFCLKLIFNMTLKNWLLIFSHKKLHSI